MRRKKRLCNLLATCDALNVTGVRARGVRREPPRPPLPAPLPLHTLVCWKQQLNTQISLTDSQNTDESIDASYVEFRQCTQAIS